MVARLRAAFSEAEKLPPQDQEMLAAYLLEGLGTEPRTGDAFARTQEPVTRLAEEAVAEYRRSKTRPFGMHDLTDD